MPYFTKIALIMLHLLARPTLGAKERDDSSPHTMDVIQSRGFIGELYKIKSPDGYTLSLYHLINPLADPRTLNKYPIILFHGIMGDSAQMISNSIRTRPRRPLLGSFSVQPDDTSLAFMFSNNNFDVWIMDSRGSNLNNHKASDDLDILQNRKFYNFSLDEQALFDMPSQLTFVLQKTQADKFISVAYSESTFFTFALLSTMPQWAERYAAFIAMAPIAYLKHLKGAGLGLLTPYYAMPDEIIGNATPQPIMDSIGFAIRSFCSNNKMVTNRMICGMFAQTLAGEGVSDNEVGFYANIFKGTSLKAFKHFTQVYFQDRFGMYDFGPLGNMAKYGRLTPPNYDLSKIRLNTIVLVRGLKDFLSNPEDQARLLRELGTRPYLDIVLPTYNHFDFIMGNNIINEINLPVLKVIFGIITNNGQTSPLRDPNKPVPPPSFIQEPLEVVQPNGHHHGPIQEVVGHARLVSNLFSGISPTVGINIPGISLLSSAQMPQGISIQGLGQGIDGLGDSLNTLPDFLLSG